MNDDDLDALRAEVDRHTGPARAQPLTALGQALAQRYWRVGPGQPGRRSPISTRRSACSTRRTGYLEAGEFPRGMLAILAGLAPRDPARRARLARRRPGTRHRASRRGAGLPPAPADAAAARPGRPRAAADEQGDSEHAVPRLHDAGDGLGAVRGRRGRAPTGPSTASARSSTHPRRAPSSRSMARTMLGLAETLQMHGRRSRRWPGGRRRRPRPRPHDAGDGEPAEPPAAGRRAVRGNGVRPAPEPFRVRRGRPRRARPAEAARHGRRGRRPCGVRRPPRDDPWHAPAAEPAGHVPGRLLRAGARQATSAACGSCSTARRPGSTSTPSTGSSRSPPRSSAPTTPSAPTTCCSPSRCTCAASSIPGGAGARTPTSTSSATSGRTCSPRRTRSPGNRPKRSWWRSTSRRSSTRGNRAGVRTRLAERFADVVKALRTVGADGLLY